MTILEIHDGYYLVEPVVGSAELNSADQRRYETLLDMRMNNEIPKEVFSRKQQEMEKKIAELEQQMMQYGDVKPATEAEVSGKLENLRRLMEQPPVPEEGEFSEEDVRYISVNINI